ncbi:hypothetical protein DQ04_04381020 [Trypanosoma grayi]|uniref:hypothetical protein n=1 Tax=Trypanosoma grayi TaxID=71804 RepID=UPI0004F3F50A|nr:hypothetical protein DQ04_04381020 [Trypanosoma grayi]KEG09960.1 hypothetical protein DQ04_04381020 [Trypanosoma grayi]
MCHQLPPHSLALDAEFEAAARRFHGSVRESDLATPQQEQRQQEQEEQLHDRGSTTGLLWRNGARVEAVGNLVRLSRKTQTQCEADITQYLWPEERLLWYSLKEKMALLQERTAELAS